MPHVSIISEERFTMSKQQDKLPEFWKEGCEATAKHALSLLRLAGQKTSIHNVLALLHSAPRSEAELSDTEARRRSFCRKCLDIAYEGLADAEALPSREWDAAEFHFLHTLPGMAEATRKLLIDSFAGIFQGLGLEQLDSVANG